MKRKIRDALREEISYRPHEAAWEYIYGKEAQVSETLATRIDERCVAYVTLPVEEVGNALWFEVAP